MPDLAAFANMGYPFTRMADLSETAVLLPEGKNIEEIQTYLNLMGRMGASTGLPVTGVKVGMGTGIDGLSGKDLLVIGTAKNQPVLAQWSDAMPAKLDGVSKEFRFSDIFYRLFSWWRDPIKGRELADRTQVVFSSGSNDAAILGFESPLSGGRSVVVVAGSQSSGLNHVTGVLQNPELVNKIQGAIAIIRGKEVQSTAADEIYTVGNVNPLVYMYWKLSRSPILLVGFALIAAAFVAAIMYYLLRARARARLKQKS
jgi:cellulose synthase operon protein B